MPGQYYIFVPFSGSELAEVGSGEPTVLQIAKTWRTAAQGLTLTRKIPKKPFEFQPEHQEGLMAQVTPDDTVYIIGHCTQGGQTLNSSRNVRMQRAELDPAMVAVRASQYFPASTVNFKLYACFGGAGHGDSESFCSRLHPELKRFFPQAKLTGYLMALTPAIDENQHKVGKYTPGGAAVRPSTDRALFE